MKSFTQLNNIFESKLPDLYSTVEGRKVMGRYMKLIRENDILKEQYGLFTQLKEGVGEDFKANSKLVEEYVSHIPTIFEKYSKKQIKEANEKLYNFIVNESKTFYNDPLRGFCLNTKEGLDNYKLSLQITYRIVEKFQNDPSVESILNIITDPSIINDHIDAIERGGVDPSEITRENPEIIRIAKELSDYYSGNDMSINEIHALGFGNLNGFTSDQSYNRDGRKKMSYLKDVLLSDDVFYDKVRESSSYENVLAAITDPEVLERNYMWVKQAGLTFDDITEDNPEIQQMAKEMSEFLSSHYGINEVTNLLKSAEYLIYEGMSNIEEYVKHKNNLIEGLKIKDKEIRENNNVVDVDKLIENFNDKYSGKLTSEEMGLVKNIILSKDVDQQNKSLREFQKSCIDDLNIVLSECVDIDIKEKLLQIKEQILFSEAIDITQNTIRLSEIKRVINEIKS